MLSNYPDADTIRTKLLDRADTLGRLIGLHRSAMSKRALNDTSFLHKVAAGENFTIRSYARMMRWIDKRYALYERQVPSVKKKASRQRNGSVAKGPAGSKAKPRR